MTHLFGLVGLVFLVLAEKEPTREETLAAYRAAETGIATADAAYANEISLRINSGKPFDTLIALRRLHAVPHLVDAKILARLVALMSNTAPIVANASCLEQAETVTQCPMTSLANEARALLVDLEKPEALADAIIARVTMVPGAAADLAPLVDTTFSSSKTSLLGLVRDAKTVDEQAALLLLATEMRCAANEVDVAMIKAFLSSRSLEVRVRAALVVLKRSDGCDHTAAGTATGARQEAVKILSDSLTREQPATVLMDVARIGITASPLMPVLLKKLDAPLVSTVQAFTAMKYRARPAIPRLVALLDDPRIGSLQGEILHAISAIRPSPDKARSSILKLIQRAPNALPEAARALADIEAPTSPSEFEYLSRLYRKQCADGTRVAGHVEALRCEGLVTSLVTLGSRGNHVFVPLNE